MAQVRAEEALQRAVVQLLAIYEARGLLAYAHCPNGERRDPVTGGRLKALGVRPGVPDLLLWMPGGHFQIELKTAKGRLSADQGAWIGRMSAFGHRVHVCRTVDEVEAALRDEGVPMVGRLMEVVG